MQYAKHESFISYAYGQYAQLAVLGSGLLDGTIPEVSLPAASLGSSLDELNKVETFESLES